jgi:hypothetical protein
MFGTGLSWDFHFGRPGMWHGYTPAALRVRPDFFVGHSSRSCDRQLGPPQGRFYKHESQVDSQYLGAPDDIIDCPTESQRIFFGPKRRRVPRMIDRPHRGGPRHSANPAPLRSPTEIPEPHPARAPPVQPHDPGLRWGLRDPRMRVSLTREGGLHPAYRHTEAQADQTGTGTARAVDRPREHAAGADAARIPPVAIRRRSSSRTSRSTCRSATTRFR